MSGVNIAQIVPYDNMVVCSLDEAAYRVGVVIMGFFKDFIPVFRKHRITLIEKRQEVGNIVSFRFRTKEPLNWKAGQHGMMVFEKLKLEGGSTRGFSVASSPDEGVVMLSTRIGDKPSAYKKRLSDMQPGDSMMMRGPFGPFYVTDPSRKAVFIAGGIGITPFRSLILDAVEHRERGPKEIHLLHADDSGQFAFKEEFDSLAAENSFIRLSHITGRDGFGSAIRSKAAELGQDAVYFVSGPPAMVKWAKGVLAESGIVKKNIRSELYFGL